MEDLTPTGLSKDGRMLLLVSEEGAEFTVRVDHRLRSALKGDLARLGQLEMTMESTLRPRDIQTRIRAGESAEEVAAAAGTTVDKIMGFAGPVLAERAHIAESAQASSVRRRSGESSGARVLSESAVGHLRTMGTRPEDVAWDAWQRDDGRWAIVADYVADNRPRHAEFTYDAPGRYVVAENDEARLLTGEATAGSGEATTVATSRRRLSAVPSSQDELPLGDDAIQLVQEDDEPADGSGEDTSDLSEVAEDLTADHADADWIAQGDAEPDEDADAVAEEPAALDEQAAAGPAPEEAPADKPAARRGRKKRSSVPSWDEIMFGGGGSPE